MGPVQASVDELREYSARWGANALLVQGAGGNTSLKSGDRLLVKASGFRLADALRKAIFVDVDLEAARGVADGKPLESAGELRPSIEASLHATMPHRVVAHLHMVDAIAVAVRRDAQVVLAHKLEGLRWVLVPYLKPGVDLARSLRSILQAQSVDIVVLGNHGIVFGADTFAELDAMVGEVARRLQGEPVVAPGDRPALEALALKHGLEPARFDAAHWAASDPANMAFARSGTLYPDHVVFLGRGAGLLGEKPSHPAGSPRLHLAPGIGALLDPGLPDDAHEMAACLGEVTARIERGASIRILTTKEEDELLNWDAERYRQELERR